MPGHTLTITKPLKPLATEEDRTDSMCEPAGQPTLAAVQLPNVVPDSCTHESLSSEPSFT
jgi:hypothetical protein